MSKTFDIDVILAALMVRRLKSGNLSDISCSDGVLSKILPGCRGPGCWVAFCVHVLSADFVSQAWQLGAGCRTQNVERWVLSALSCGMAWVAQKAWGSESYQITESLPPLYFKNKDVQLRELYIEKCRIKLEHYRPRAGSSELIPT